jgi:hypothetical protein
LAGVWSRNTDAAGCLADAAGCRNYATLKELMEDVDIVDIVVAPNAQVTLAIEAARRGVHLLLENPLAGTPRDANLVAEEIAAIGGAMPISPTEVWSVRSAARHVDLIDEIDSAYPEPDPAFGFSKEL